MISSASSAISSEKTSLKTSSAEMEGAGHRAEGPGVQGAPTCGLSSNSIMKRSPKALPRPLRLKNILSAPHALETAPKTKTRFNLAVPAAGVDR